MRAFAAASVALVSGNLTMAKGDCKGVSCGSAVLPSEAKDKGLSAHL